MIRSTMQMLTTAHVGTQTRVAKVLECVPPCGSGTTANPKPGMFAGSAELGIFNKAMSKIITINIRSKEHEQKKNISRKVSAMTGALKDVFQEAGA